MSSPNGTLLGLKNKLLSLTHSGSVAGPHDDDRYCPREPKVHGGQQAPIPIRAQCEAQCQYAADAPANEAVADMLLNSSGSLYARDSWNGGRVSCGLGSANISMSGTGCSSNVSGSGSPSGYFGGLTSEAHCQPLLQGDGEEGVPAMFGMYDADGTGGQRKSGGRDPERPVHGGTRGLLLRH